MQVGTGLAMANCTIALNQATGGTGGQGGSRASSGTSGTATGGLLANNFDTRLVNVILGSNLPTNCLGVFTDDGNNLSSDSSAALTNRSSSLGVDPGLLVLADNGGPTLAIGLRRDSPAIDAANTAAAPSVDQRGFPRPVGTAADIGAYEYSSPALLRAEKSPGGGVDLFALGVPRWICVLQATTDFATWTRMATNSFGPQGTATFHQDTEAAPAFYRLLLGAP